MEIFNAFNPAEKMNFMTNTEVLTSDLKIRLWDNIGKDNRLAIWRSCSEQEVYEYCRNSASDSNEPSTLTG